jgi:transcriptional regulator with XRE-family HTH domain
MSNLSSMSEVNFLVSIGSRIKDIRMKKNMTQFELAVRCEFEKASMSRIESGKTNPTVLTLKKIGKALDVPVCDFLKEN